MSCYHPNLLQPLGIPRKDNPDAQAFVFIPNSRADNDMLVNSEAYGFYKIPCGKCLGCRLDYSRMWADRMMLELETAKKGVFVTLTYNEDSVPEKDGILSLDVRDAQLFMKNVRRQYDGRNGRRYARVRFFLAGEYGPTGTHRPHLHCILFGLGLEDFPCRIYQGVNELGHKYYRCPELEYCWGRFEGKGRGRRRVADKGFVTVSDVSWNTFAYVARYVVKKALPNDQGGSPADFGAVEEFCLMSRRPGIGADFLKQHPACLDYQKINVPSKDGVRSITIPKYYLNICSLQDPEKCDIIKEQRKCAAIDSNMSKLSRTTLSYMDQLEVEEERKKLSFKGLSRDFKISHNL